MERIRLPFSEFSFTFAKSGGPGGQNVNKVESKAILIWDPSQSVCPAAVFERFRLRFPAYVLEDGRVQIVCQEHRSQKANVDACIEKLHRLIEEVRVPPKPRKKTKPKRSAVLKRLDSKKKDAFTKRMRRKDY